MMMVLHMLVLGLKARKKALVNIHIQMEQLMKVIGTIIRFMVKENAHLLMVIYM